MAAHTDREHFIPIRKADLVDLLCREPGLTAQEQEDFRQLCRLLEATFHFEYHDKLEDLKSTYAPFDPDAEMRPLVSLSSEEKQKRLEGLFTKFIWLLERANFKRLSQAEIREALRASTDWGLNLDVDFSVFDRLEVFARGDTIHRRTRRRWRKFLKPEEVVVPVYQRLVVILRLRPHKRLGTITDTQNVFIKIFKDIPHMDLEMLLPGTRVRMSLMDRVKFSLPTLTGLSMIAWKLPAMLVGGVLNLVAVAGVPTVGYGVRSFFGYVNTKKRHQLTLTTSLYFLNLDNNVGVLFRLLDEAEEQECREAMLAYFFLWRHAGAHGWTESEMDEKIELFLEKTANVQVDFEIGDALSKLERLGLVEELPGDRLRAVPIHKALESLDEAWDNYFRFASTQRSLSDVAGS